MSTILKALKKLETEQDGRLTQGLRSRTDFSTRQVVNRTVRFAWLKRVVFRWFAISAIFVAFVSVVYFFGISYLNPISQEPQQGPKEAVSMPGLEESSEANQQRAAKAPSNDTTASSGLVSAKESQNRQAPAIPFTSKTQSADKTPLPAKEDPQKEGANPPAAVSDENPIPFSATKKPLPSDFSDRVVPSSPKGITRYSEATRLSDGRLTIQAIAWAPIADNRIAVINNRIVHEGDTVDSFSILAINEDDVVVRGEGQTWKVLFGQP